MHDRDGRPNQDAVGSRRIADAGGDVVVAAVADGHGGERYVRSNVGSRFAVDVTCDEAARVLAGHGRSLAGIGPVLARSIVIAWREAVLGHLAEHPLDEDEERVSGAREGGDPVIAYGATLLMALASRTEMVLLQLGDGDIVVATADGRVLQPIPGDDRLVGGQTTSLCLPQAMDDVRTAMIGPEERPVLVLLSSDGYGNSFADKDWATGVALDMVAVLERDGSERVGAELPRWLRESAVAGGDDVTVALLTRRGAPDGALDRGPRRTPRGRATALGATVVVAAVAFGSGWLIRGDGGSTDDGHGALAAVTTSPVFVAPSSSPSPSSAAPTVPTTAPSIIGPSNADFVRVPGPAGGLLVFLNDRGDPQARLTDDATPPLLVTRLVRDGVVWQIDGAALTTRSGNGALKRIALSGLEPASLVVTTDVVWVVDAAASSLVAVDPATFAVAGEPHAVAHPGAIEGGANTTVP